MLGPLVIEELEAMSKTFVECVDFVAEKALLISFDRWSLGRRGNRGRSLSTPLLGEEYLYVFTAPLSFTFTI